MMRTVPRRNVTHARTHARTLFGVLFSIHPSRYPYCVHTTEYGTPARNAKEVTGAKYFRATNRGYTEEEFRQANGSEQAQCRVVKTPLSSPAHAVHVPKCRNGHFMEWSNQFVGVYATGFTCDGCRGTDSSCTQHRWNCSKPECCNTLGGKDFCVT